MRTTVILLAALCVGVLGLSVHYLQRNPPQGFEARNDHVLFESIADRISGPRLAKLLVLDQKRDAKGVEQSTVLFAEFARDGKTLLPARQFTVSGSEIEIETRCVQLSGGDWDGAFAGKTATLFVRAGDVPLETAGEAPDFYRADWLPISEIERKFWADVWQSAATTRPTLSPGVKAARSRVEMLTGIVYFVSVDAAGLLFVVNQPMDGTKRNWLYQEQGNHP